jgi:hypothetical protein
VTEEKLARLLAKTKLVGHAPAIAFELAYGHLAFPDHGEGRGWRRSNVEPWLVGPAACLEADLTWSPPGRKKLAPVLYTTNDVAYYLAADGIAWGEDTIGDEALAVVAPNARAMMTRILLREHVFFCPSSKKVEIEGSKGASAAKALKLRSVPDASDATERWWSDGTSFVVERMAGRRRTQTTIAYAPKGVLAKIGIADPAPRRSAPGPITFDTVTREGASVCAVILVKATLDAVHAAFSSEPCCVGTVSAIDDSNSSARRLQLQLTGSTKKKSRVEVFFRPSGSSSTLLNVYQFDVKDRDREAVQAGWFEVLETVRAKVEQ